MKAVYLDYAATTPVDPAVTAAMLPFLDHRENFGNSASAIHSYGITAQQAVAHARSLVACLINAPATDIIFTHSATEANNIALQGAARFYAYRGKHIITTAVEHKSVLSTCEYLSKNGYDVTVLYPDATGIITAESLKHALREDTILVSIMHVNNETGVLQDLMQLASIVKQHGAILHVDAAQSIGKIVVDVACMPVDLLTIAAHKIYGPKGVGALYIRSQPKVRVLPIMFGGDQEQKLVPGTIATHQIVGFGHACQLVTTLRAAEVSRIMTLHRQLWTGLAARLPHITLHGHATQRVPGILNIAFHAIDGEALLAELSAVAAVSSGSACNLASTMPSYVLTAMGVAAQDAHSSLRLSIGRFTTAADIADAVQHICVAVERLRRISPLWPGTGGTK